MARGIRLHKLTTSVLCALAGRPGALSPHRRNAAHSLPIRPNGTEYLDATGSVLALCQSAPTEALYIVHGETASQRTPSARLSGPRTTQGPTDVQSRFLTPVAPPHGTTTPDTAPQHCYPAAAPVQTPTPINESILLVRVGGWVALGLRGYAPMPRRCYHYPRSTGGKTEPGKHTKSLAKTLIQRDAYKLPVGSLSAQYRSFKAAFRTPVLKLTHPRQVSRCGACITAQSHRKRGPASQGAPPSSLTHAEKRRRTEHLRLGERA